MLQIASMADYQAAYQQSVQNPTAFWDDIAASFYWRKRWHTTLEWDFKTPNVRWFEGGTLNITENCLDRHLSTLANHPALIWEPNNPDEAGVTLSYQQLYNRVNKMAGLLQMQGVRKGDRVCVYMPMIPELAITVLACARIGAIHSVVFGGFSATAIADRIQDAGCTVVITSDGAYRGAKEIPMKDTVDQALTQCDTVNRVLVFKRTHAAVSMHPTRDVWVDAIWDEAPDFTPPVEMEAEDPLFILYTSGSTGKPKGVVHSTGGYMVYTGYTFAQVFQYKPGDVYWCTADVGWITGHSYLVYGPLLNGATSVMFEGIPTFPDAGRFWQVIDKHKVSIFYTAPTAIRSLMAEGEAPVLKADLSSLRILGSVGEPINQEAWDWYHTYVGKKNCPIVDTWWQTETGGMLISPIANVTPLKPTFATLPLPGIQPILVDEKGNEIEGNDVEGMLCIRFPWPSIIRTTYGDHERCRTNYFATFPNLYFTGDGARRDADGFYRIIGRVDDVINVSGHRIGTAEVENAINEHPDIVESAVVGFPHDIKGQGIYAYCICHHHRTDEQAMRTEILALVTRLIGPIAKPDRIQFVSGLPKTRSGKIMRRILRKIAEGAHDQLGDTSTLLDPGVVHEIIEGNIQQKGV